MKRLFLCFPLTFVAACSGNAPTQPNSIDINAAALRAQGSVDAYGANSATEIGEPDARRESDKAADAERGAGNTAAEPAPLDPPAPGAPGGLPDDRTPVSEASFAPDSAQGAANVVQTYYALIGEKNTPKPLRYESPMRRTLPRFPQNLRRIANIMRT